jgi:hypothetical protein
MAAMNASQRGKAIIYWWILLQKEAISGMRDVESDSDNEARRKTACNRMHKKATSTAIAAVSTSKMRPYKRHMSKTSLYI